MTSLLRELERKLAQLPAEEQESWIAHFLEELATKDQLSEGDNQESEEDEWIGGRRPTQEEVSEAIRRIEQLSRGSILGNNLTLKELINEGRRY
jgi:hypothetical protein